MRFRQIACLLTLLTANVVAAGQDFVTRISSPDQQKTLRVWVADSQLTYDIYDGEECIIADSNLGVTMDNGTQWGKTPNIINVESGTHNGVIRSQLAERSEQVDRYSHSTITLSKTNGDEMDICIRLYDEGFAINYSGRMKTASCINADGTTFNMSHRDMTVYYESGTESGYVRKNANSQSVKTLTPCLAIGEGLSVTINEAGNRALAQKATVAVDKGIARITQKGYLKSQNVEWPWRYMVWGKTPLEMIEGKYIMRSLTNGSESDNQQEWIVPGKVFRSIAGATLPFYTDTVMAAIDFAKEMNFQYVLLDAGWYGLGYSEEYNKKSNPFEPVETLDIEGVCDYADENGIGIIAYVNRVAWETYDREAIIEQYANWGIKGIKMGFVDGMTGPGLQMVYDVIEKAGDYGLIVNVHDNMRPTGVENELPQLLTTEGIRGNEHEDNTSWHTMMLPFTRFMSGAADYTFCFDGYPAGAHSKVAQMVQSKGHQMALSVIYFSPLQHLLWYGRPWWYATEPHEVDFFRELVTVWDDYKILDGEPGEHFSIARKSKDRWFVGTATNEARYVELPLDFMDCNLCNITTYEDDGDGGVKTSEIMEMNTSEKLTFALKANGGAVAIVEKASDDEIPSPISTLTEIPHGEVEIFDLNGIKIKALTNGKTIHANSLPPGIYIVRIHSNGHAESHKLLVK